MRRLSFLFLLVVPLSARADAWWGTDKVLHLSVSAGLTIAGYASSALFFDDWVDRALVGATAAWSLGVAKELADSFGAGDPSLKDLTWDFVGCVLGAVVSALVDRWVVEPLFSPAHGSS